MSKTERINTAEHNNMVRRAAKDAKNKRRQAEAAAKEVERNNYRAGMNDISFGHLQACLDKQKHDDAVEYGQRLNAKIYQILDDLEHGAVSIHTPCEEQAVDEIMAWNDKQAMPLYAYNAEHRMLVKIKHVSKAA